VLGYLRYPELPVQLEACRILEHVGTAASIPALEAAAKDPNPKVGETATKALLAIKARK
jgi:HEAT repeat protein